MEILSEGLPYIHVRQALVLQKNETGDAFKMVFNCNKEVIYYWMPLDICKVEVLFADKSKSLVRNVMITSIWAAVSQSIWSYCGETSHLQNLK